MQPPCPDAPAPRRSDATRAAILAAARERFAADGYERATIRAIARDADIDPSMVMRYYGNKAGLFAAASAFQVQLPDLRGLPAEELGPAVVHRFLEMWESDETLTALLRVGATNEAGAERMRGIWGEQVKPLVAAVCPDPAEAAERAALLSSQILGLALTRYVLRLPPAVEMAPERLAAWYGPVITRILTAPQP